jgi:hypothetical protein
LEQMDQSRLEVDTVISNLVNESTEFVRRQEEITAQIDRAAQQGIGSGFQSRLQSNGLV